MQQQSSKGQPENGLKIQYNVTNEALLWPTKRGFLSFSKVEIGRSGQARLKNWS